MNFMTCFLKMIVDGGLSVERTSIRKSVHYYSGTFGFQEFYQTKILIKLKGKFLTQVEDQLAKSFFRIEDWNRLITRFKKSHLEEWLDADLIKDIETGYFRLIPELIDRGDGYFISLLIRGIR